MNMKMTEPTRKVWDAAKTFGLRYPGQFPTLRELADTLLMGDSTVSYHLRKLAKMGYIARVAPNTRYYFKTAIIQIPDPTEKQKWFLTINGKPFARDKVWSSVTRINEETVGELHIELGFLSTARRLTIIASDPAITGEYENVGSYAEVEPMRVDDQPRKTVRVNILKRVD